METGWRMGEEWMEELLWNDCGWGGRMDGVDGDWVGMGDWMETGWRLDGDWMETG